LQRCYQGQTSYCSFVQFDNSTLGIADIIVKPVNLSELYAQGVDFELGYHHDLAPIGLPGVIDATVYATYMPHLETTTQSGPGGITTEEAGTQAGQPKWTMSAFVNYQLKPFMVGVEARAFSSIAYSSLDVGPGQPGYSPTLANSINQNVFPGLVYFNLNGAYDFVRDGRKYQLFANINNLLNTNPPAYALAAINLGGNPYDYVGRTFKVGVRFGF
jgi:outer membrane receptor protein involved in Fe transport